MSRDQELDQAALTSSEQLIEWFAAGAKGPDAILGVGTEHEKIGFLPSGDTVPFFGDNGIEALFERLVADFGWEPHVDGDYVMALTRDGAAITLEPGGQLELSGAVFPTVFGTRDELERHISEVTAVGGALGQTWTSLGLNPFHDLDQVPWMPKPRYNIMREYLPKRGVDAPWMMKMTTSIQANYDYRDESDAFEMLRVGAHIAPIVTALFANSPVRERRLTGSASSRMEIWYRTDPDRCGVPALYLDPSATFADYVEWLLDVPMFFLKREGRYLDFTGRSFREFVEHGLDGHTATMGDFELHVSTVFPDIRMKQYIEVRTADGGNRREILALAALWKGIFYDAEARKQVLALVPVDGIAEREGLSAVARAEGLRGSYRGRSLRDIATELLTIAGGALDRLADGESERVFLRAMQDEHGVAHMPAERFSREWISANGDPCRLIRSFPI